MKSPTATELKRWCNKNAHLAIALIDARETAKVTREKVNKYVKPIFESYGFTYCGPLVEKIDTIRADEREPRFGQPLPSEKDLYLCDDPRLPEYYAALDAEHRRQGYTDLELNHCPALVAEHNVIKAEWALMDAADSLFGLGHPSRMDLRAEYIKILVDACVYSLKRKQRLAA